MIKHVRITNYKSLGDVSVSLDPVTVLIGRSGSGKTAFVEALRFLRDYVAHRGEAAMQFYGNWQRVLSATAPSPVSLLFQVRFDAPGIEGEYEYLLRIGVQPGQQALPHWTAPQFREERLSLGDRLLFHQAEGKWVKQPNVLQLPQPGQLVLGALTGLPEVTVAHLVLTSGIGWYAFSDAVLTPTAPGAQFGPQRRLGEAGLADNAGNFVEAFAAIVTNLQAWAQHKEIVAALRHLNRSIASLDLQMPNRDKIVVGHSVGSRILVLDLDQESEGLRRFLAYLVALYQSPPKQTLIFEEPEKGLHPGALATLAEQFKACAAAGRGQIILTTHSPDLLDQFPPENLRAVEIHDGVTQIGPIAQEQVEAVRENLLHPGELLTVDPARIAEAVAQG
jgi:predicted ATPase